MQFLLFIRQKPKIFIYFEFDAKTGRTAFLGLGFGDRSDSFDLNVALQDHFKWVKNQEKIEQDKADPKPELDLAFKKDQTIRININITVSTNTFSHLFNSSIEHIMKQSTMGV